MKSFKWIALSSVLTLAGAGCGGGGSDGNKQDIDGNIKTDRSLTTLPLFLQGHEEQCHFVEGGIEISLVDYTGNLDDVTELVCLNTSLDSLEEIVLLTALQVLVLHNTGLSDISVLGSVTTLEELDLSGNNITDITALGNLLGLILLNLAGNDIIDLSPLISLTYLETLDVSGNDNLTCDDVSDLDEATAEMVDIAVPSDCTNTLLLNASSEAVQTVDNSSKTVPYDRVVLDVIDVSDVAIYQFGNDLHLEAVIGEEVKLLIISNWFLDEEYQIDEFEVGSTGVYSFSQLQNAIGLGLKLTEGDDIYDGSDDGDYIFGLGGNDIITGQDGKDIIVGGPGNDHLSDFILTVEGDVITRPSKSDLYIYDDNWIDTFIFNIGDGHDTLYLYEDQNGYRDTLKFTGDVTSEDITLIRNDEDLILKLSEDDSVTIKDWFKGENHHLGDVILGDDTALDAEEWVENKGIISSGLTLEGTSEGETLKGSDGDDIIIALDGKDTIIGGLGNDHLSDFILNVESGIITRPSESDVYDYDDNWIDTFIFNVGDGHDTLYLYEDQNGYRDLLHFTGDVAPKDITLFREGDDLMMQFSESDSVTVKNWFIDENYRLGDVQFGEAKQMDAIDWVNETEVTLKTPGTLKGSDENNVLAGTTGNDIIFGLGGRDTIIGGPGDDHLSDFILTVDGNTITRPSGTSEDDDEASDIFIFNAGDGHDTLYLYEDQNGYRDLLHFTGEVTSGDITLYQQGMDLVLQLSEFESVTIKNWYAGENYRLRNIQFGETDPVDAIDWVNKTNVTLKTPGTLEGSDENNVLLGTSGDDVIIGQGGHDTIEGGAGNDHLSGNRLEFKDGEYFHPSSQAEYDDSSSDTFIFNSGDGQDTIYLFENSNGYRDILELDPTIDVDGITASQDGNNLILSLPGSDMITFKDWFVSDDFHLRDIIVEGIEYDAEDFVEGLLK